jgi:hypothetical protein
MHHRIEREGVIGPGVGKGGARGERRKMRFGKKTTRRDGSQDRSENQERQASELGKDRDKG